MTGLFGALMKWLQHKHDSKLVSRGSQQQVTHSGASASSSTDNNGCNQCRHLKEEADLELKIKKTSKKYPDWKCSYVFFLVFFLKKSIIFTFGKYISCLQPAVFSHQCERKSRLEGYGFYNNDKCASSLATRCSRWHTSISRRVSAVIKASNGYRSETEADLTPLANAAGAAACGLLPAHPQVAITVI